MKVTNVLAAVLLMVGAAACSTVPSNDQTQTSEVSAADSLSKDASASADPTGGSAPSVDAPAQDPLAAPAPIADTSSSTSAPSSLGASSSGRGH